MAFFSFGHRDEVPKNKQIQDLALDKIEPNQYQPRHQFSEESINELAQTLDKEGLLQPIVVRESDNGYEIIAGERRYRAAQSLGWETIPAIVKEMDDDQAASLAVIENLQRENLNPIDEAQAYKNLMKLNDLTQTALAKEMGKSQSYVANKLRLLKLTPKVQASLIDGNISARHGRALVGLDEKTQEKVLSEVLAKGLNVKETEAIVKDVDGYFNPKTKKVKKQGKSESKKRVVNKMPKDLKVQINTIKRAVKLAEESGIEVKVKENNNPDDYRITIEMKRK
ncbi:MAG: nucleoid occlusion protein [Lactobacillus sp.]|nr:nucleoid occlusion protein [Lactobacillus sp.]